MNHWECPHELTYSRLLRDREVCTVTTFVRCRLCRLRLQQTDVYEDGVPLPFDPAEWLAQLGEKELA